MTETILVVISVDFEQRGCGLNLSLVGGDRRVVSGSILGRAERSCKMHGEKWKTWRNQGY